MAKNNTYSVIDNVITSGDFSVRYVMENGSPRFVLTDIFKSLKYKNPSVTTHMYCKSLGLGKVTARDNKLRTYATLEETEIIFDRMYFMTPEFRAFWENEVIPATDAKYAALRTQIVGIRNEFKELKEINNKLVEENKDLTAKLEHLVREREAISNILSMTA